MNSEPQAGIFSSLRTSLSALREAVLLVLGLLLFFEEIRLYDDLGMDAPLAMACWSLAVLLTGYAVWRGRGNRAVNIAVLSLNLLVMALVIALMILLSGPMRLF